MAYNRCASVFLTRRTALMRNSGLADAAGEAGGAAADDDDASAAGEGEDGKTTSEREADSGTVDEAVCGEKGRDGVREASGRSAGLLPAFCGVAFLGDSAECIVRARVEDGCADGDAVDTGLSSDSGSDSGDASASGTLSVLCANASMSAVFVIVGAAVIASGCARLL
jgi:hypothetical protein